MVGYSDNRGLLLTRLRIPSLSADQDSPACSETVTSLCDANLTLQSALCLANLSCLLWQEFSKGDKRQRIFISITRCDKRSSRSKVRETGNDERTPAKRGKRKERSDLPVDNFLLDRVKSLPRKMKKWLASSVLYSGRFYRRE